MSGNKILKITDYKGVPTRLTCADQTKHCSLLVKQMKTPCDLQSADLPSGNSYAIKAIDLPFAKKQVKTGIFSGYRFQDSSIAAGVRHFLTQWRLDLPNSSPSKTVQTTTSTGFSSAAYTVAFFGFPASIPRGLELFPPFPRFFRHKTVKLGRQSGRRKSC